ncbi:MAG: DUF4861 domain-containing protein [Lewinellaceae bacterium]|nr:DUF4861 domain-containing protein [Saprospiraceae bacterium]MCB9333210.1 DUF4861 domain-containing protein [Lewinellaceae bacterium]
MQKFSWFLILVPVLLASCQGGGAGSGRVEVVVKNPENYAQQDVLVHLNVQDLLAKHPGLNFAKIKVVAGAPLPFQIIDADANGSADEIAFLIDLDAGASKSVYLEPLGPDEKAPEFKKRTQAELSHKVGGSWQDRKYQGGQFQNVTALSVPPEHTDHSWYIRYEGPGWESDLVGYRFYLDWRNATDIFGKKTTDMVLQNVGQDGFDSYHEPGEWGMDILKVGESLGIGSLGSWLGDKALRVETTDSIRCEIPLNGPILSMVRTNYSGWKVGDQSTDAQVDLSIQAGSRMTRCDVMLSQPLPNLCTGIVKDENAPVFNDDGSQEWAYLATWGSQSLAEDQLGMAIVFPKQALKEITEDAHSHVVVFNPEAPKLSYYFLAAWEQEPGGIKTQADFQNYLNTVCRSLSHPVQVTIK